MDPVGILPVLVILACLAFVVFRVKALWQCWTGVLIVSGDQCFYVCGFSADDPLGLSSLQILDRKGRVFLADGNEIHRLRTSELKACLLEDELRVTERNLKTYRKICIVRTHNLICLPRTAR
jgi:hypothetical protein